MGDLKSFFDTPEELFVGAMLQWPLYFLIGWDVGLLMLACGLLWRLGGWSKGNKLYRRIGVPLAIWIVSGVGWPMLLAGPFMVWLAPSYGKESWLFKLLKNDFKTRVICFAWYWSALFSGIVLAGI